jgi:hypothetical protein
MGWCIFVYVSSLECIKINIIKEKLEIKNNHDGHRH